MIYDCYDVEGGRLVSTVGNVAAPVKLTGALLTDASAAVTVASTVGLWPGMLLAAKYVPAGTLVLSVDTDTTFTMTAPATGAVGAPGVIMTAYGYDTTVRTETWNIENYRDLFSGMGAQGCAYNATHGYGVLVAAPEGFGIFLDPTQALTTTSWITGQGLTTTNYGVAGTPKATVSDQVGHVPPRDQSQKGTFVRFVCADGTQVPVQWTPTLHIVQRPV